MDGRRITVAGDHGPRSAGSGGVLRWRGGQRRAGTPGEGGKRGAGARGRDGCRGNGVTPCGYNWCMPRIVHPRPTHRACSWCATEFPIIRRPGRPRLYCRRSCRQRAYEHRHGFVHERTVRPLPGQRPGDSWTGSGYERGVAPFGKTHAMRTSVRAEGSRRETLCGLLARPFAGQHFVAGHQRSCVTCTKVADANPLRYGINPSNELATLRSLLEDIDEHRVPPTDALHWIRSNSP